MLKKLREKLRRVGWSLRPRKSVANLKTNFWQTPEGVKVFMKGSDATQEPSAAVMNAVLNEFFLGHCPPGAKVLDLGSGHGIVSLFLAQHGMKVTACDISQLLLDELRKKKADLEIEIRQGDAHQIPAADGEFDVVVSRMFLGHFSDWPKIVSEMARCCRIGGKLLVHFTSHENDDFGKQFGGANCKFATSPELGLLRADPFRYFAEADEAQIRKVAADNSLRIVARAPNTFFFDNHLIGRSLGAARFEEYEREFANWLADPKVRDFVIWFEQNVVQHLPVWISYYNVLVLEKMARRS
jgi:ubiquinone/menaquinone biosynthesis C-methylase UbiE